MNPKNVRNEKGRQPLHSEPGFQALVEKIQNEGKSP